MLAGHRGICSRQCDRGHSLRSHASASARTGPCAERKLMRHEAGSNAVRRCRLTRHADRQSWQPRCSSRIMAAAHQLPPQKPSWRHPAETAHGGPPLHAQQSVSDAATRRAKSTLGSGSDADRRRRSVRTAAAPSETAPPSGFLSDIIAFEVRRRPLLAACMPSLSLEALPMQLTSSAAGVLYVNGSQPSAHCSDPPHTAQQVRKPMYV